MLIFSFQWEGTPGPLALGHFEPLLSVTTRVCRVCQSGTEPPAASPGGQPRITAGTQHCDGGAMCDKQLEWEEVVASSWAQRRKAKFLLMGKSSGLGVRRRGGVSGHLRSSCPGGQRAWSSPREGLLASRGPLGLHPEETMVRKTGVRMSLPSSRSLHPYHFSELL